MTMKKKNNSLSVKTLRSTIQSCIIFGLVAQIVALTFFAYSLTMQYISTADSTVKQARMSITHGTDSIGFCEQVMETYCGLSDEERNKVGSPEYRKLFASVDTQTNGGSYDVLMHMLSGILEYHTQNDLYDIYIAMYDKDTSAMVYIVDSDLDESERLMPGDWESVTTKGMMKFLEPKDKNATLYDIGWTKKYGLLCTVGVPIEDEQTGEVCAFVLADISLNNILSGMVDFFTGLTVSLIAVTVLISFVQTKHIKKDLIRPIKLITEASNSFANSNSEESQNHFGSLDIHSGDEIEHLVKTMAKMEDDLYEYGSNLLRITKEKERIGTELELARKIQADMLPNIFPPFPDRNDFDIYATMTPAKEVGGDFYDFFLIDDDHLGMVMADVSGKGVPAALFMMMSKILLNNFVMQGGSPAKVLEQINGVICQNNDEEMFVTVWIGVLEISTGRITAANAGHEYPVIRKADGDFELFKDKHGFVVGGMEGMRYKEYEMQLEKGGTLFLYTDGVPEATNGENELFGTDRLLEAMNQCRDADPKTLLTNVKSAVDEFVGEAEQFDDLTMLGITLR